MAIVFPNNTISELSSGIVSYPQKIVQIVDNQFTANVSCNNWSTQNEIATASITPKSASNQILIYIQCSVRADMGAGNWSLGMFWLHNTTSNVNLIRSGWEGTWRNTISTYRKQYLHSPSSTATQNYSLRVGNYPSGTHHFNNTSQNGHDGYGQLRLVEFAV